MDLALNAIEVIDWNRSPLMNRCDGDGSLNAPYLCAFLKHHVMPMSKERMMGMHGHRLWQRLLAAVPGNFRIGTAVQLKGLSFLVKNTNHGFEAPLFAQQALVSFVQPLSATVAADLKDHYATCWAFRSSPGQLASPPSHLDFFKDERVRKSWRECAERHVLLLHANDLLRTWPALMQSDWDVTNVSRDCQKIWESMQTDVAELHRNIDDEGE